MVLSLFIPKPSIHGTRVKCVVYERTYMLTLDDLVTKDKAELDQLFREGDTPDEDALEGETRGRVLAGRGPLRLGAVRQAVNGPLLPWKGKTFARTSGKNRFEFGPIERQEFEFDTKVQESLLSDDNDVLTLDYDQPANPPGIRQIRDDLKELEEGLYLGTANLDVGDDYEFILYFALEKTYSTADVAGEEGRAIEIE